jgi:hypothetical protein
MKGMKTMATKGVIDIDEIKQQVDEYFSNNKRPPEEVRAGLEDLRDYVESCLDALADEDEDDDQ